MQILSPGRGRQPHVAGGPRWIISMLGLSVETDDKWRPPSGEANPQTNCAAAWPDAQAHWKL
jgi:hypothetical protein